MSDTYRIAKGSSETTVEIGTLKKEFSQYLQIENLNFLIGSGCSSCVINQKEHAIPTMFALFKDFFEVNPGFQIGGINAEYNFNCSLEELLDFMFAVKLIDSKIAIDTDIIPKISCVQNYIRQRVINGTVYTPLVELYKQFYLKTIRNNRQNPINIFTTNYDLYNEIALDSLGFYYNSGFTGTYNRKFNPISYSFAFVENLNLNRDVWQRISNYYNLYKIHGSITWVNDNEQVYERKPEFIKPDDAVMIYPVPLKDRSTLMTPYSDLLRSMQGALMNNNSILITMGYSFSDDHINRIILNALAVPSFRLIVLGNSKQVQHLKAIGDSRITIINSDGIQSDVNESKEPIHYFRRIVNELMPDIRDDVQETIQLINGAEAISRYKEKVEQEPVMRGIIDLSCQEV